MGATVAAGAAVELDDDEAAAPVEKMYGFRLPLPLLLETPEEDDAADRGVVGGVAEGTCCLTTTLGLDAEDDEEEEDEEEPSGDGLLLP